jgi:hypothetical protein
LYLDAYQCKNPTPSRVLTKFLGSDTVTTHIHYLPTIMGYQTDFELAFNADRATTDRVFADLKKSQAMSLRIIICMA